MGKGKLAKFAEMAANPLVVECPFRTLRQSMETEASLTAEMPAGEGLGLKGKWHQDFFHNDHPIVLELGCGRGEYTVGLGRMYPEKNYIGVDIKGSRMWTGAQDALNSGMENVGFLRTNIEFIQHFFAPGEVSEIWLTFSDPQMKKATKRLTSTYFLERYRQFMLQGGLIHLKTDSNFLFTYTEELLKANDISPLYHTRNLYGDPSATKQAAGQLAASIQTYYESMWRGRGIDIKYLCFQLPTTETLTEPNVEIPLDEYRSYSREKRSGCDTHR